MNKLRRSQILSVVEQFAEYAAAYISRHDKVSLGTVLENWIADSDVIVEVGGDYGTFMLVVALIIAQFHEDPQWFGERAAEVVKVIFHLEECYGALPNCIDRDHWKEWVFRRQCGLPIEL
jgi:hypothetical protein